MFLVIVVNVIMLDLLSIFLAVFFFLQSNSATMWAFKNEAGYIRSHALHHIYVYRITLTVYKPCFCHMLR